MIQTDEIFSANSRATSAQAPYAAAAEGHATGDASAGRPRRLTCDRWCRIRPARWRRRTIIILPEKVILCRACLGVLRWPGCRMQMPVTHDAEPAMAAHVTRRAHCVARVAFTNGNDGTSKQQDELFGSRSGCGADRATAPPKTIVAPPFASSGRKNRARRCAPAAPRAARSTRIATSQRNLWLPAIENWTAPAIRRSASVPTFSGRAVGRGRRVQRMASFIVFNLTVRENRSAFGPRRYP